MSTPAAPIRSKIGTEQLWTYTKPQKKICAGASSIFDFFLAVYFFKWEFSGMSRRKTDNSVVAPEKLTSPPSYPTVCTKVTLEYSRELLQVFLSTFVGWEWRRRLKFCLKPNQNKWDFRKNYKYDFGSTKSYTRGGAGEILWFPQNLPKGWVPGGSVILTYAPQIRKMSESDL